jgi:hypothetical protein
MGKAAAKVLARLYDFSAARQAPLFETPIHLLSQFSALYSMLFFVRIQHERAEGSYVAQRQIRIPCSSELLT